MKRKITIASEQQEEVNPLHFIFLLIFLAIFAYPLCEYGNEFLKKQRYLKLDFASTLPLLASIQKIALGILAIFCLAHIYKLFSFNFKIKKQIKKFCEALIKSKRTSREHEIIKVDAEYKTTKNLVLVRIFTHGLVDDKEKLGQQLGDFLKLRVMDIHPETGAVRIKLARQVEKKFTCHDLDDFQFPNRLEIKISQDFTWQLQKQPMGLIVGGTGSGKTKLIQFLILSFLYENKRNKVIVIDGKSAYLSQVMRKNYDKALVACNPDDVLDLLERLNNTMEKRYLEMEKLQEDKTYIELFQNSGAILLVVDEILSLITLLKGSDIALKASERLAPKIQAKLLALIVKGRQANIHVLISGQQLPAEILPTSSRDSIGLRIALGRVSNSQALEIYALQAKDLPPIDTKRFGGIIYLDGLAWQKPRAFLAPYADLDFAESITQLKERSLSSD